jgi:hypothetical protein
MRPLADRRDAGVRLVLRIGHAVDGVLAPGQGHGRNPHRVVGRATWDHIRQRRIIRSDFGGGRPGRLHCLPFTCAQPCHCLPGRPNATA